MKRPIKMQLEFVATALSMLMQQHGITEFTFSQEEFYGKGFDNKYLKLMGDFKSPNDTTPTACTMYLFSEEEVHRELH